MCVGFHSCKLSECKLSSLSSVHVKPNKRDSRSFKLPTVLIPSVWSNVAWKRPSRFWLDEWFCFCSWLAYEALIAAERQRHLKLAASLSFVACVACSVGFSSQDCRVDFLAYLKTVWTQTSRLYIVAIKSELKYDKILFINGYIGGIIYT
jgi:hypothetical protein